LLPQLVAFVADQPEKVNWKLGRKLTEMPSFLEDLRALVGSTEGMQHLDVVVSTWQDKQITTSEAVLQLLPALMALPFDAQVTFAKGLFSSQEEKLKAKVQSHLEHHPWIPTTSLVHESVTCDGCNMDSINGVRFKCTSCPNYDLCAACFTKKARIHPGDCSAHDFEAMIFPECASPWMAMWKGKGKGKCNGKAKGKGKAWWSCDVGVQQRFRPCAREGCEYSATWHASHCCGACARGHGHGGCCEKQVYQPAEVTEELVVAKEAQTFDMTFPVEVSDGRCLTISWNHGADCHHVARVFAEAHGILPDELPTIVQFESCLSQFGIQHATAMSES